MFKLQEANTSVRTELSAGLTTFLTMVYIVIVNPVVLSSAGVPFEQVFTATIISAVIGTLWMALAANYPVAIAPGMGLNAYFAVICSQEGITYTTAFSAVFIAGLIFLILSLTSFREKLIDAIPDSLKNAITTGIGLFIAFIGLRNAHIIVDDPTNLVKLGDLTEPGTFLTIVGLAITLLLMALRINAALFLGMIATAIIALCTGQLSFKEGFFSFPLLPEGLIVFNPITALNDVITHGLYAVVFSFLLVTIFDTTGTMVGVAQKAGLMKEGKMPRLRQALLSDSFGTTFGAMFGTSPTTAFVESSSGVAAGGRTGLTTLTVGILFIVAAFFSPLVGAVSGIAAITSPALIIVGSLMMESVAKIEWKELDEAFPAFLVILSMPLTSSIATGIALGFISYPLIKLVKGKGKNVHPLVYIFALLFFIQLMFFSH
ncbi:NCS2 family permease [Priestia filamentosa]|uniref:NCS2 family permease n=1 Tax=Priestia filamentosa TaxID=1402861 RepID=UPI000E72988C|nr:NCS2 family permease [Priestia filamentosa]RJS65154.1 guanine permease [Priestia filamentosa]